MLVALLRCCAVATIRLVSLFPLFLLSLLFLLFLPSLLSMATLLLSRLQKDEMLGKKKSTIALKALLLAWNCCWLRSLRCLLSGSFACPPARLRIAEPRPPPTPRACWLPKVDCPKALDLCTSRSVRLPASRQFRCCPETSAVAAAADAADGPGPTRRLLETPPRPHMLSEGNKQMQLPALGQRNVTRCPHFSPFPIPKLLADPCMIASPALLYVPTYTGIGK